MFEFTFIKNYLWPKKRQLSVALIGFLSLFVISIVVWLLLLFLSITEGIEKTWLNKLTSLNAPIRITPTEAYYNSYYYQVDAIAHTSNYAFKSIGEKLNTMQTDPYDPSVDETLPDYWPTDDSIDFVKVAFGSLDTLGLKAEDYEVAGALMRLELIRPNARNSHSFLSQVSYVSSYPAVPTHLATLLQSPSTRDIRHMLYMAGLQPERDLTERIKANLDSDGAAITLFDEMPQFAPPWAHFVKGKLCLPENGVVLPKQFRDNDVLLGDHGYFSYQAITPMSTQEQKLSLYVAGFYDPGVISVGARFILADPTLVRTMNASCQTLAIDPLMTNGIQVWFTDLRQTQKVAAAIRESFKESGIDEYWDVVPYYEYDFAKELIGQFQSDRYLFSLVGILILTVACSNVISLLLLLVNDKRHEIGVLLSLGASKKSIALIFGGIGIVIGFVSSLIGVGLATFTLSHIDIFVKFLSSIEGRDAFSPLFYGDSLPSTLSLKALSFVFIVAPILSFLAGLIPAVKACRLKPSQILRSE